MMWNSEHKTALTSAYYSDCLLFCVRCSTEGNVWTISTVN